MTRCNQDAIVCVMLCFGSQKSQKDKSAYLEFTKIIHINITQSKEQETLPKNDKESNSKGTKNDNLKKEIETNSEYTRKKKKKFQLKSNHVYIYSPCQYSLKIYGATNKFLLLSFYIDKSVIESLNKIHQNDTKWYDKVAQQSSRKRKEIYGKEGTTQLSRNKKRRLLFYDDDSLTIGYVDLKMLSKQEGDTRSCLQDAFINAGMIFGKDIRAELYREVPPQKYNNTEMSKIVKSSVIQNNFVIQKDINFTDEKGGNEWILLNNRQKTGVYIVWCNITPKDGRKEKHAFVYDSDFCTHEGKEFFGAIVDNRKYSNLRLFEKKDVADVAAVRRTLNDYFLGHTVVCGWIKVSLLSNSQILRRKRKRRRYIKKRNDVS